MNKYLFFILSFFYAEAAGQNRPLNLNFKTTIDTVSPGLIHYHFQSDTLKGSPLNIHLLNIDLSKIKVKHALAMDQILGQETTSHMSNRYGALAGVNGGFSFSNDPWNVYHGDPRDFFMLNGKMLSEPYSTRTSFGIVEDTINQQSIPFFDQISWYGEVIIDGKNYIINGVNRKKESEELIVYTPEWAAHTMTHLGTMEIVVVADTIHKISEKGSSTIPCNGFVIAVPSDFQNQIKNKEVVVNHNFQSLLYPGNEVATTNASYNTAGPLLIKAGKVINNFEHENISESFVTTRHPRTAVGITENRKTLILVTVDGRQSSLSMGMSLAELAQFLSKQKAFNAYNLDGGGSTTMVINNQIVNSPSDPKERRRCDAVLLFPFSHEIGNQEGN